MELPLGTILFLKDQNEDATLFYRVVNNTHEELIKIRQIYPIPKDNDKTTIKMPLSELNERATIIRPHALISFTIVNVRDLKDVLVLVYRNKEIEEQSQLPYIVCRQNITDFLANSLEKEMNYCGLSISADSMPVDMQMEQLIACDGLSKQVNFAFYMNDTLSDILSIIKTKDFDNVLFNLHATHVKHVAEDNNLGKMFIKNAKDGLDGYYKTLKGLLKSNNFLNDIQTGFGIYPLNMDLSYINPNDGGYVQHEDIDPISIIANRFISNVFAIRYDLDINIKELPENSILISDKFENLYVVTYDLEDGEYKSAKTIYDYLRFDGSKY